MRVRAWGCVGAIALAVTVTYASTWTFTGATDDSTQLQKQCGNIVDTYGCLNGWGHYNNGTLNEESYADIGAEWDKSQYLMAVEAQNVPPLSNWAQHAWSRTSLGGGAKRLFVYSTTTAFASGSAGWMVPFEEWWFSPAMNVQQIAPRAEAAVDGGSYQVVSPAVDPDHATTGTANSFQGGGTGISIAYPSGTDGDWCADLALSDAANGPSKVRVKFETLTTPLCQRSCRLSLGTVGPLPRRSLGRARFPSSCPQGRPPMGGDF